MDLFLRLEISALRMLRRAGQVGSTASFFARYDARIAPAQTPRI